MHPLVHGIDFSAAKRAGLGRVVREYSGTTRRAPDRAASSLRSPIGDDALQLLANAAATAVPVTVPLVWAPGEVQADPSSM
jgi:hypothetical protein